MKNNRVVNTGSIGDVQDSSGDSGDSSFDLDGFMAGFTRGNGGGVINAGTVGNVQNQTGSGSGNTQSINRRR